MFDDFMFSIAFLGSALVLFSGLCSVFDLLSKCLLFIFMQIKKVLKKFEVPDK